ncbi:GNAT family N-acetyltransferase [Kribbella sp. NPDC055071]
MHLPDHDLTLELLTAEHADPVLAFELANRAYFATWIWDRGDDYFTEFAVRHAALLAEQQAGTSRFHALVDGSGAVAGRINLVDLENGSADLGYRIAEKWAGRGLATAAVRAIIGLAATSYGLTTLTAGASDRNPASQTVLSRTGFRIVGTSSTDLGPGKRYELTLESA